MRFSGFITDVEFSWGTNDIKRIVMVTRKFSCSIHDEIKGYVNIDIKVDDKCNSSFP